MKLQVLALTAILATGIGFSLTSCGGKNPVSPSSFSPTPTTMMTATPTATVHVNGGNVTTFAGNGTANLVNGAVTVAEFHGPAGVAVDSNENVYVADYTNNVVRKISNGQVSTFATGFSAPSGIAVDASGNVYVADSGNEEIKKITPGGTVSVLAGTGSVGHANGSASSATFDDPYAVTVDASGNVYVADYSNQLIRKISGGQVSTLAGTQGTSGYVDATGTAAEFYDPYGIATDSFGNVYVADYENSAIRKITAGGVVSTFAIIYYPITVAVDSSNNVYVADDYYDIWEYSSIGVGTFLAGDHDKSPYNQNGQGNNASFYYPSGLSVDANGKVYVADWDNELVRLIQ